MRPLEWVVVLGAALGLLGWGGWAGRGSRRARLLTGALLAVTVLHLVLEGQRAPMWPAYLGIAALVLGSFRAPQPRPAGTGWRRALRWAGGGLALALIVAPPILLPVMRLPAPTGSFAVGTTWLFLVDSTRAESFTPDPADFREVAVKVWYPAPAGIAGKPAPYASIDEVLAPILPLPRAYLAQFRLVRTHAIADAPLAGGDPFPTLVFSHGYTGSASQNTVQMEELASQGYVVFSVVHAYEAAAMPRPDGSRVLLSGAMLDSLMGGSASRPSDSTRAAMQRMQQLMATMTSAPDAQTRRRLFKGLLAGSATPIRDHVQIWTADTRFVVDRLEELNSGGTASRFAGRLDLGRLGIFGMSYGGATAGEFCRLDRRCRAGLNMDGAAYGGLIDDSIAVPFMIMGSSQAAGVHLPILDRLRAPGYLVVLDSTTHLALTDVSLFAPALLRWMGVTGAMDSQRREQIMTAYVLAFFDRYLRDRPSSLLDGPAADYPDVRFTRVNP